MGRDAGAGFHGAGGDDEVGGGEGGGGEGEWGEYVEVICFCLFSRGFSSRAGGFVCWVCSRTDGAVFLLGGEDFLGWRWDGL